MAACDAGKKFGGMLRPHKTRRAFREYEGRKQDFLALLLRHRKALKDLYASAATDAEKLNAKAALFVSLKDEYQIMKAGWGGYAGYELLPNPEPVTRQYYYVNQGPTYGGPGQFAPVPTYQETAIGWRGYPRYDGGPYANPYDHHSYGYGYRQRTVGPVVFTPRLPFYSRPSYRYGASMRHAPRSHYAQPRVIYGSHHGYAPRHGYHQGGYHQRGLHQRGFHQHGYHQQRALRRAY
jgi:hypothetical protein